MYKLLVSTSPHKVLKQQISTVPFQEHQLENTRVRRTDSLVHGTAEMILELKHDLGHEISEPASCICSSGHLQASCTFSHVAILTSQPIEPGLWSLFLCKSGRPTDQFREANAVIKPSCFSKRHCDVALKSAKWVKTDLNDWCPDGANLQLISKSTSRYFAFTPLAEAQSLSNCVSWSTSSCQGWWPRPWLGWRTTRTETPPPPTEDDPNLFEDGGGCCTILIQKVSHP